MKIFALLSDSAQYYDRWIAKGPYKTERLHVGGFKRIRKKEKIIRDEKAW